jgi:hypothetical protein
MIPDNIGLPIWILSQVFAFFALISIILAFQSKTKTKTLLFTIAFNSFMSVATILLQNYVLTGIVAVAVLRDITFILREKYRPDSKVWSYLSLFFFLALSLTVSLITATWWFDYLLLVTALFLIYGSWAKGVHLIRISRVAFCALVIVNHVINYNYVGIVIEVFSILSIAVFYIKFYRYIRKQNQLKFEQDFNHQADSNT